MKVLHELLGQLSDTLNLAQHEDAGVSSSSSDQVSDAVTDGLVAEVKENQHYVGDEDLPEISLREVSEHCHRDDAWTVIYDKVYDVTEYIGRHPGGEDVLMEYVGYDATIAFRGVGHSKAAFRVLEGFCIGILPKEERLDFFSPNLH